MTWQLMQRNVKAAALNATLQLLHLMWRNVRAAALNATL